MPLPSACLMALLALALGCGGGSSPASSSGTAPALSQQPTGASVIAGDAATFKVSATGDGPLAYQWRRNDIDVAGATNATYTLASTSMEDAGARFSVLVSNGAGHVLSSEAKLSVGFKACVIVRSSKNLPDHTSVVNLVNQAKTNGIATLVIGVKQDEDDEFDSGTVFYASTIAPRAYPDFDVLQDVVAVAHQAGIQVQAWVPQFHDQVAFKKGGQDANGHLWAMKALVNGSVVDYTYTGSDNLPDGRASDYFVNPCSAQVQAYERSIVQEIVNNYDVDGVVLDWIRYDNWNMDMGPATIAAFQSVHPGEDPAQIDFANADPNTDTVLAHWQDWRTSQIGTYVQAVRADIDAIKPGLPLGIYVLPPEFVECGQDASKFKDFIQFISPMCYFKDWDFTTDWVFDGAMADTRAKVGSGVAIIPALDAPPAYTNAEYQAINTGIRSRYNHVNTESYFIYGAWTSNVLESTNRVRRY